MVPVADLCFCTLEKVQNEVSLCSKFKVEFIVIPSIYNTPYTGQQNCVASELQ